MTQTEKLFEPVTIGPLQLKNRIVMAPMTRSRASETGIPSDHASLYYAQRASAGLIITEGAQPSANGQGYARTPGMHAPAQTEAWRNVTEAVHAKGGTIFLQLMHTGRIAHRLNRTVDGPPVAPSAIRAAEKIYTDVLGPQDHSVPRALATEEIPALIDEYRQATINALAAGFDGIELHAANGYLPMQFLSSNSNQRSDRYGGTVQNRARFVIETLESMADGAGTAGRIGLRVSPGNTFNDMHDADPRETYVYLIKAISRMGLAYLHVQRSPASAQDAPAFDAVALLRPSFEGPLIATGGLDRESANHLLAGNGADLVGFARLFIANPDLVERLHRRLALAKPDETTFYSPGPQGYTDYPTVAAL
jgi:N-ethylmaleimide reductase